ncbi:molybdopterin-guanine dinucleotide biosynthesis protein B [Bradyrhizobium septentrionale]|uniref:Molybdopterin-guanine dinucleotide biosynthesis protein B n=1 Tax=Bradyrhizobium septentrionale TaxID=1404411 RepID=A0ABZ2P4Z2_9BRAD
MQIIGVVGSSGSGKTTLIQSLMMHFGALRLEVSTVKHAHHGFDIDRPGKDSFLHRAAGAKEVLVVSDRRWALLHECVNEPKLEELLLKMTPVDLIIIEGYKLSEIPKIEVYRSCLGKARLNVNDQSVFAVVSDDLEASPPAAVFRFNEVELIAKSILLNAESVRTTVRPGTLRTSPGIVGVGS